VRIYIHVKQNKIMPYKKNWVQLSNGKNIDMKRERKKEQRNHEILKPSNWMNICN
jgi:hypothetical protein